MSDFEVKQGTATITILPFVQQHPIGEGFGVEWQSHFVGCGLCWADFSRRKLNLRTIYFPGLGSRTSNRNVAEQETAVPGPFDR